MEEYERDVEVEVEVEIEEEEEEREEERGEGLGGRGRAEGVNRKGDALAVDRENRRFGSEEEEIGMVVVVGEVDEGDGT